MSAYGHVREKWQTRSFTQVQAMLNMHVRVDVVESAPVEITQKTANHRSRIYLLFLHILYSIRYCA